MGLDMNSSTIHSFEFQQWIFESFMRFDIGYKDNLSFNVWLELIGGN